jgi:hypothetical protein
VIHNDINDSMIRYVWAALTFTILLTISITDERLFKKIVDVAAALLATILLRVVNIHDLDISEEAIGGDCLGLLCQ